MGDAKRRRPGCFQDDVVFGLHTIPAERRTNEIQGERQ